MAHFDIEGFISASDGVFPLHQTEDGLLVFPSMWEGRWILGGALGLHRAVTIDSNGNEITRFGSPTGLVILRPETGDWFRTFPLFRGDDFRHLVDHGTMDHGDFFDDED